MNKEMTILIDNVIDLRKFNNIAMTFPCEIDVISGRYTVDGRSLMGLLSLDLSKPVQIKYRTEYHEIAKLYFTKFEVKA